jgi:hypothetical protein
VALAVNGKNLLDLPQRMHGLAPEGLGDVRFEEDKLNIWVLPAELEKGSSKGMKSVKLRTLDGVMINHGVR